MFPLELSQNADGCLQLNTQCWDESVWSAAVMEDEAFYFNQSVSVTLHSVGRLQEECPQTSRRRGMTRTPSVQPKKGLSPPDSPFEVWTPSERRSTERIWLITKCHSWSPRGVSSSCSCQPLQDHLLWMRVKTKSRPGRRGDASLINQQRGGSV